MAEDNHIFILGGARSGKSAYALKRASEVAGGGTGDKIYLATAHAGDDEMRERVEKHQGERAGVGGWRTVEELVNVAGVIKEHGGASVILVDCITLWVTNILAKGFSDEDVFAGAAQLVSAISGVEATVITVSNEVGLGIVPTNALARRFRDVTGMVHQMLAASAGSVYFVTAGIPNKIK